MTVKEFVEKEGWYVEGNTKPSRVQAVNVSFVNSDGRDDETQFDIRAYDVSELSALFKDFCKENGFKDDTVTRVSIVAMAESEEELEAMGY